ITNTVIIRFRAAGNAPILKKNVYRLTSTHPFSTVLAFLRSQLAYKGPESLFVYVNSAFSPAPDEPIINLYRCFATGGQLILHYSTTAAWG
ncbi:MAG: ubiquitin-like protein Atg12, partial [Piptocephalis tieghemiana]